MKDAGWLTCSHRHGVVRCHGDWEGGGGGGGRSQHLAKLPLDGRLDACISDQQCQIVQAAALLRLGPPPPALAALPFG